MARPNHLAMRIEAVPAELRERFRRPVIVAGTPRNP
jgi:hypothetical protein